MPRSSTTAKGAPARRKRDHAGLTRADLLARHPPGETPPEQVLELLLGQFNLAHTAREKTVSHKTRHERAQFLRRFFRDLRAKAGFATTPDPRNLGNRHILAMVQVWRTERLAPATIQTYLSFLRGLAQWIGKPGLVRKPAHYGLCADEFQRHEVASRDKSWSGQGIDIEQVIVSVCRHDIHVGASLRLIWAFGLRRKEAVMFQPHSCVVHFEATGLPSDKREANHYIWIKRGAKGGRQRFVPINTARRQEALVHAQAVTQGQDAHMGRPERDLKQNLWHFSYVVRRFGISLDGLGATTHGLRHESLIDEWQGKTGVAPPVRGGPPLPPDVERAARTAVAHIAGHCRKRASCAYLGSSVVTRRPPEKQPSGTETDGADTALATRMHMGGNDGCHEAHKASPVGDTQVTQSMKK
ncbi:MAG: integrase [Curvibacter sp.]|jgi:site-specific recombinase XerC|nr:MAG: integrase [Curvibacter sp.]